MLDRTTPPPIRQLSEFSITRPDRRTMKNGMPLNIIHAGTAVAGYVCQQDAA